MNSPSTKKQSSSSANSSPSTRFSAPSKQQQQQQQQHHGDHSSNNPIEKLLSGQRSSQSIVKSSITNVEAISFIDHHHKLITSDNDPSLRDIETDRSAQFDPSGLLSSLSSHQPNRRLKNRDLSHHRLSLPTQTTSTKILKSSSTNSSASSPNPSSAASSPQIQIISSNHNNDDSSEPSSNLLQQLKSSLRSTLDQSLTDQEKQQKRKDQSSESAKKRAKIRKQNKSKDKGKDKSLIRTTIDESNNDGEEEGDRRRGYDGGVDSSEGLRDHLKSPNLRNQGSGETQKSPSMESTMTSSSISRSIRSALRNQSGSSVGNSPEQNFRRQSLGLTNHRSNSSKSSPTLSPPTPTFRPSFHQRFSYQNGDELKKRDKDRSDDEMMLLTNSVMNSIRSSEQNQKPLSSFSVHQLVRQRQQQQQQSTNSFGIERSGDQTNHGLSLSSSSFGLPKLALPVIGIEISPPNLLDRSIKSYFSDNHRFQNSSPPSSLRISISRRRLTVKNLMKELIRLPGIVVLSIIFNDDGFIKNDGSERYDGGGGDGLRKFFLKSFKVIDHIFLKAFNEFVGLVGGFKKEGEGDGEEDELKEVYNRFERFFEDDHYYGRKDDDRVGYLRRKTGEKKGIRSPLVGFLQLMILEIYLDVWLIWLIFS